MGRFGLDGVPALDPKAPTGAADADTATSRDEKDRENAERLES